MSKLRVYVDRELQQSEDLNPRKYYRIPRIRRIDGAEIWSSAILGSIFRALTSLAPLPTGRRCGGKHISCFAESLKKFHGSMLVQPVRYYWYLEAAILVLIRRFERLWNENEGFHRLRPTTRPQSRHSIMSLLKGNRDLPEESGPFVGS